MPLLRTLYLTAAFVLTAAALTAQADSDVLFTVDDTDVTVGEFKYIYAKSNGDEADYSKASVQEYLDLYERFKLKVARARAMGLDTISSLQRELEGYRKQLADNYIIDRQVTDKLVEQLYERQQKDVEFSHIFFKFTGQPTPADTLAMFTKVAGVKNDVTPENFAAKAAELSDDGYSKSRGGRVGFVNAPFPKGLGNLEAALYTSPANTIIGPIRTSSGYHLATKLSERPAYGEMEVGHVLVRKEKGTPMGGPVPAKMQEAKAMIDAGEDFARVAAELSEDRETKNNAGYLGFFGINFYDPAFEQAAFALDTDGAISDVVETQAGYHLIRRVFRRRALPLDDVRPLLEGKIKQDPRFTDAKKRLLDRTRKDANLVEQRPALRAFTASLDDVQFAGARWEPTESTENPVLYTMDGGQRGTVADFQQFILKNSRLRTGLARSSQATTASVVDQLYGDWLDEETIKYAESRLEKDYPDFAALMREYREGILLFEATKLEVWDKATDDTSGLASFYENHRDDYQWEKRAEVSRYVVSTKADLDVNQVLDFTKSNDPAAVTTKFRTDAIEITTDKYEYDRLADMEMLKPEVGSVSMIKNDLRDGTSTFYKVESLVPAARKELSEARGYVIADYQDELERRWVEQLRTEYPVKINKRVLNKIIQ
ncbi:peptidyl-prolyl cis-trans isomerase SurA [Lewinella antarctica]|uniref:peptidylprolyl isomerase n=2 Tax=Neolewinella antarctica TaxID=442734 RepID=A0ABX0XBX8_9BACT|nr:peptidyl-prolyl cis-trans isomerase SurA [Neolewinella antarctica]